MLGLKTHKPAPQAARRGCCLEATPLTERKRAQGGEGAHTAQCLTPACRLQGARGGSNGGAESSPKDTRQPATSGRSPSRGSLLCVCTGSTALPSPGAGRGVTSVRPSCTSLAQARSGVGSVCTQPISETPSLASPSPGAGQGACAHLPLVRPPPIDSLFTLKSQQQRPPPSASPGSAGRAPSPQGLSCKHPLRPHLRGCRSLPSPFRPDWGSVFLQNNPAHSLNPKARGS